MPCRRRFLVPFALLIAASLPAAAATVDGLHVHHSAAGDGPPTLILIHGWTCDERAWASQVPALSAGHRVITVDLPGHGRSDLPADGAWAMDLFARAIEAVREQEKAERVVLVGHSLGVPALLQYARLHPERARALVLVDGSVTFDQALREPMLQMARVYGESPEAREQMVQAMYTPETPAEVRRDVLAMISSPPAATAIGAIEAFVDSTIWRQDVFPQPVLAVYSGASLRPDDPESDLDYMRSRFPDLEYVKMDEAGHFLMMEKPEEFNRLLLSFLATLKD